MHYNSGPHYQPTIKSNEQFYAVSAFLYSFNTLNIVSENGTFSPAELKAAALSYCSKVSLPSPAELKAEALCSKVSFHLH